MLKIKFLILSCIFFPFLVIGSKVEIVKNKNGYQLIKDGKPFYIKGAGGTGKLEKLKEYGGNSIRTWGIDSETDELLENAKKNDISVCFGIWIGQERQGFDYSNEQALVSQLDMVRQTIRKYKNHPSILIWGIGNEMDLDYTNFEVWKHMEEICKIVKQEDPNHPTMLVTAGLDVAEIKLIKKHTPSLDILGINTYGNINYLKKALDMYDWKKPYIVAEWGPYGWWEVKKTSWGAAIEETSSEKAKTYQESFTSLIGDKSTSDPEGDEITYQWQVIPESMDKKTGGDKEKAPKPIKGIFKKTDTKNSTVNFTVELPGEYRLFIFAKDGNGNVATGNIPFKIIE